KRGEPERGEQELRTPQIVPAHGKVVQQVSSTRSLFLRNRVQKGGASAFGSGDRLMNCAEFTNKRSEIGWHWSCLSDPELSKRKPSVTLEPDRAPLTALVCHIHINGATHA